MSAQGRLRLAPCDEPRLFKGLASGWPALERWRFERLMHLAPRRDVELVEGDRESGGTRFVRADLRGYLADLAAGAAQLPYLKEFDLLDALPDLRADHRLGALLPRRHMHSMRCWIGPAGASTGLHHDRLDNVAVQIVGSKRFRLLSPGSVERLGRVSAKYDAWAVLAQGSIDEIAARLSAHERAVEVVLEPGDVLQVPARWWHAVSNPSAGILLSAFHGPRMQVSAQWLGVQARQVLHRAGLLGRAGCTCHAARDLAAAGRQPSASA